MRVGVITFHFVTNQGALLQCYALQRVLAGMGHEPVVMDYRPDYHMCRYAAWKNPFVYAGWYARRAAVQNAARRFLLYPAFFLKCCKRNLTGADRRARKKIDTFVSHAFSLTRFYRSLRELKEDPPQLDAYLSGSDQVWNPDLLDQQYDPAYFLAFGDPRVRRLTYAVSVGRSPNEVEKNRLGTLCQDLDFISLREYDPAVIEAVGKPVSICLDPTLLLDRSDYAPIEASCPEKAEPFIFVYGFETNENIRQAVRYAVSRFHCRVVNGSPQRIRLDMDCVSAAPYGPDDFLGYINSAACVVTNSFHGTALSIVYQKDFICVPHTTRGARMRNLLAALDLSTRLWGEAFSDAPVDYAQVFSKLDLLREESLRYLTNALSEGAQ